MVIRFRLNFLLYSTAILVALKVFEVIDWSWGWVLAPLWLPMAIIFGIAVVSFFFAASLLAKLKKSVGWPGTPGREEIVINDDEPLRPEVSSRQRIGNIYDHE